MRKRRPTRSREAVAEDFAAKTARYLARLRPAERRARLAAFRAVVARVGRTAPGARQVTRQGAMPVKGGPARVS